MTSGKKMGDRPLRIMAIGAHPDDCDAKVGGLAIKYARQGHQVKFVSLTNGDAGHHEIGGVELAKRRYQEAQKAAQVAGIEYELFDIHDGELVPILEYRKMVIETIRGFQPDLVITHRPNDYHPDHRYTSQLVQDAAYTVTVPNIQSLTPYLMRNPVFAYMSDSFQRPYPFSPDIAVSIDDVVDTKLDMLDCHESQMYEWLPYNKGVLEQVPQDAVERRAWLGKWRLPYSAALADRYRPLLKQLYGPERGEQIRHIEAFEICEYGAAVGETARAAFFPFFA
jgi:LmbE family N-acetylglucosaminyl deacetylase